MKISVLSFTALITLAVVGLISGCGSQGQQSVVQPSPYATTAAVPNTVGCTGYTGYPAGYNPAYTTGCTGTGYTGYPTGYGYPGAAGYGYPGYVPVGYAGGYAGGYGYPAYGGYPVGYGYPGYGGGVGGGAWIGVSFGH